MSSAQRLVLPGLHNFARVAPGLYRGAQPERRGWRSLQALGIRTVLNLRSWHRERLRVRRLGMTPVELPLQADVRGARAPSPEQIQRFLALALGAEHQPVFVHCAHGKDRTGVLIAVYRMEVEGWSNSAALAELHAFGFHTLYRSLLEFVQAYQPRGLAPSAAARK